MKGEKKTMSQDGKIVLERFSIPLDRIKTNTSLKCLAPKDDQEPIMIYYFESGWNYGYPMYHVLIEFGDFEQTDYLFLSPTEFKEKFGIFPTEEQNAGNQLEIPFT